MPVIKREGFTQNDLPGYLKKDIKELIEAAVMVGWTVHLDSSGVGCSIRSPGGEKTIHFGTKRNTRVNQLRRDIVKFGDPHLVALAARAENNPALVELLPKMREEVSVHEVEKADDPVYEDCDRVEAELDHGPHSWYDKDDRTRLHPFVCEGYVRPRVTPSGPITGPYVTSQRPMLAKGRNDKGYLSATTFEQAMSDGTTRYACQLEGCDFVSYERQAVPNHWAKSKSHPDVGLSEQFKADVPNASHYRPRENRVQALAKVLADMYFSGETPDFGVMATAALTWVHEQSSAGTDLAGEREDLTAEEIVARITAMLDTGQMGAVVSENQRLAAQVVELETRVTSAEAQAQRAHDQWTALVELISEAEKTA